MVPAITSCAPSHSTRVTPPNITMMIMAVITPRARIRFRETPNASSTAAPKRPMALFSRPKACTVSMASTLSPAKPTAPAKVSCDCTVRRRTTRPNRNRGTISTGTINRTKPVNFGLTKNSRATPPIRVRKLRSA